MNFGGYFSSLFAGTPSWVTNAPLRWDSHRRQAAFQASSHASCSCTRVAPCLNPTFEPKQTKTRSHWDLVSSARRRWDSKLDRLKKSFKKGGFRMSLPFGISFGIKFPLRQTKNRQSQFFVFFYAYSFLLTISSVLWPIIQGM